MRKSVKELAEEFRISYQTLMKYLCRAEFSYLKIYKGYILNYKLNDKFKIYNVISKIFRRY